VREVQKSSALVFTRSFFPALFQSGSIETAMSEAQNVLADQREDWSAYALLSSVSRLDKLRFLATPVA
jgi:hypothetical protein